MLEEQQPRVPSEQAPPARSISPSPESGSAVRVEISEQGFDARVRGSHLRRLAPWIVPALMTVFGWIGGGVLGYYEGLRKAAARVAALEVEIETYKAVLELTKKDVNHGGVILDDHESRLLRLERTLKLDPGAAAILASPDLVVKQPRTP